MKNNKFLYLLVSVILFYFTGCEGSDPARKSAEIKDASNQAALPKNKDAWKGGSPEKGGGPSRKGNNKKRPMLG